MGGAPAVLKMLLDTPQVDPVARDASKRFSICIQDSDHVSFLKDGLMPVMLSAATEREASVEILLTNERVREHINDGDANKDTALHHAYQSSLSLTLIYIPLPTLRSLHPRSIATPLFKWLSRCSFSRCHCLSDCTCWCRT